jgi:hypothetical protein
MNFLYKTLRDGKDAEDTTKMSELVFVRGTLHRTISDTEFTTVPMRATLVEIPPTAAAALVADAADDDDDADMPSFVKEDESPFSTWVVTVGKIRVSVTAQMDIHPKPFQAAPAPSSVSSSSSVNSSSNSSTAEDRLVLTLFTDTEGGTIQLKLSTQASFLRWQAALCDALTDTVCGLALRRTSSGRVSTERVSRALSYCCTLSRLTLPSVRRTGSILVHRRQLSDLQLKLSLFLQQRHPTASSIASSVLYSEFNDSLADIDHAGGRGGVTGHHTHPSRGYYAITLTQNDVTPLLAAAAADSVLCRDVDFDALFDFVAKCGYKFEDPPLQLHTTSPGRQQHGRGSEGVKVANPYRFTLTELEDLRELFMRHPVNDDDDLDLDIGYDDEDDDEDGEYGGSDEGYDDDTDVVRLVGEEGGGGFGLGDVYRGGDRDRDGDGAEEEQTVYGHPPTAGGGALAREQRTRPGPLPLDVRGRAASGAAGGGGWSLLGRGRPGAPDPATPSTPPPPQGRGHAQPVGRFGRPNAAAAAAATLWSPSVTGTLADVLTKVAAATQAAADAAAWARRAVATDPTHALRGGRAGARGHTPPPPPAATQTQTQTSPATSQPSPGGMDADSTAATSLLPRRVAPGAAPGAPGTPNVVKGVVVRDASIASSSLTTRASATLARTAFTPVAVRRPLGAPATAPASGPPAVVMRAERVMADRLGRRGPGIGPLLSTPTTGAAAGQEGTMEVYRCTVVVPPPPATAPAMEAAPTASVAAAAGARAPVPATTAGAVRASPAPSETSELSLRSSAAALGPHYRPPPTRGNRASPLHIAPPGAPGLGLGHTHGGLLRPRAVAAGAAGMGRVSPTHRPLPGDATASALAAQAARAAAASPSLASLASGASAALTALTAPAPAAAAAAAAASSGTSALVPASGGAGVGVYRDGFRDGFEAAHAARPPAAAPAAATGPAASAAARRALRASRRAAAAGGVDTESGSDTVSSRSSARSRARAPPPPLSPAARGAAADVGAGRVGHLRQLFEGLPWSPLALPPATAASAEGTTQGADHGTDRRRARRRAKKGYWGGYSRGTLCAAGAVAAVAVLAAAVATLVYVYGGLGLGLGLGGRLLARAPATTAAVERGAEAPVGRSAARPAAAAVVPAARPSASPSMRVNAGAGAGAGRGGLRDAAMRQQQPSAAARGGGPRARNTTEPRTAVTPRRSGRARESGERDGGAAVGVPAGGTGAVVAVAAPAAAAEAVVVPAAPAAPAAPVVAEAETVAVLPALAAAGSSDSVAVPAPPAPVDTPVPSATANDDTSVVPAPALEEQLRAATGRAPRVMHARLEVSNDMTPQATCLDGCQK